MDAALSSNYVDAANATDQAIPVLICAQNRGTEPLPQIRITTVVDGVSEVFRFGPVSVGETVYGSVSLSVSALQQGTVDIASTVTVPAHTDANPANNGKTTVVILKQSEQPAP